MTAQPKVENLVSEDCQERLLPSDDTLLLRTSGKEVRIFHLLESKTCTTHATMKKYYGMKMKKSNGLLISFCASLPALSFMMS